MKKKTKNTILAVIGVLLGVGVLAGVIGVIDNNNISISSNKNVSESSSEKKIEDNIAFTKLKDDETIRSNCITVMVNGNNKTIFYSTRDENNIYLRAEQITSPGSSYHGGDWWKNNNIEFYLYDSELTTGSHQYYICDQATQLNVTSYYKWYDVETVVENEFTYVTYQAAISIDSMGFALDKTLPIGFRCGVNYNSGTQYMGCDWWNLQGSEYKESYKYITEEGFLSYQESR